MRLNRKCAAHGNKKWRTRVPCEWIPRNLVHKWWAVVINYLASPSFAFNARMVWFLFWRTMIGRMDIIRMWQPDCGGYIYISILFGFDWNTDEFRTQAVAELQSFSYPDAVRCARKLWESRIEQDGIIRLLNKQAKNNCHIHNLQSCLVFITNHFELSTTSRTVGRAVAELWELADQYAGVLSCVRKFHSRKWRNLTGSPE